MTDVCMMRVLGLTMQCHNCDNVQRHLQEIVSNQGALIGRIEQLKQLKQLNRTIGRIEQLTN